MLIPTDIFLTVKKKIRHEGTLVSVPLSYAFVEVEWALAPVAGFNDIRQTASVSRHGSLW